VGSTASTTRTAEAGEGEKRFTAEERGSREFERRVKETVIAREKVYVSLYSDPAFFISQSFAPKEMA